MNVDLSALSNEMLAIAGRLGRTIRFMEVCGTHTVSLFRSGVRSMLPANVRMISGPGCPVCVTAQRHIDAAIALAARPGVVIATYGDMLRVPGRHGSLERLRADGADIRIVQSAMTALTIAQAEPNREVVFLAVGFETTAPATAALIVAAQKQLALNLSVLACHKLVLPAMLALLAAGDDAIDGFLCPGHVSVITGSRIYQPVVTHHRRPCVIAGFEPGQMLLGIVHLLRQVEAGDARLENVYPAVVSHDGNPVAQRLLRQVFEPGDTAWRAIGEIPDSGLELRPEYARFDALRRFGVTVGEDHDPPGCRCGEVIQGRVEPIDCPLFARGCDPRTPIGPCMVGSEGACAAWYRYNRLTSINAGKSARIDRPEGAMT